MQKWVSHLLFLKSISKRGGGEKWISEQKQWGEKVRSQRFCPPLLDKNRNYEGIWLNKRKSSVKPVGMNGSNFKDETLFVEEVHVKLCRITIMDLGPEMDVAELRNEHVWQRAREQEKVPADSGRFCLRVLRTKLSRMFLLRLKEIRGLSVKMTSQGHF